MTNHLEIKIRDKESFDKARSWVEASEAAAEIKEVLLDSIKVASDFHCVMREKSIALENVREAAFGCGTEKLATLFEDVVVIEPPGEHASDEDDLQERRYGSNSRAKRRHPEGHGRRNLKLHVHTERVNCKHDSLESGELCPHCEKGKLHRFKPLEKTSIKAVNLFVVQTFELESLRCGSCQEVTSASEPEEIKHNYGKYHPSAIATLAVLRYAFGMPSYRLEDFTNIQGLEISDSTQFRLFEYACLAASPVLKILASVAANSKILYRDDSPMRINDLKRELIAKKKEALNKGSPPEVVRTGITTTVIHARDYLGHKITLYATGTEHAGEVYDELMKMRTLTEKLMAMADAASSNRDHAAQNKTIELGCLTHARRNFFKLRKYYPEEIESVLDLLAVVYHVDAKAKEQGLNSQERLTLHKQESLTAMQTLFVQSVIKRMEHEENSSIYKAYQYIENHWSRLTAFLHVSGAEIENSEAERCLKWAIRHRNNSLFYKTEYGALVGDVLMSIIKTARDEGLDPIAYLQDIIINKDVVKKQPELWLPWNWKCQALELRKAS